VPYSFQSISGCDKELHKLKAVRKSLQQEYNELCSTLAMKVKNAENEGTRVETTK
jgi:hypothetical protein